MALSQLQTYLAGLDPSGIFPTNLTYMTSWNQQTGYNSKNPFSPFQFIPYGNWSVYENPPSHRPSILEQAFRETVTQGHMVDGKVDTTHSFVDILHLGQPDPGFFTEVGPGSDKSLIQAVADQINAMDQSITPVIRFLVGNPSPTFGQVCPDEYTQVFWPGGDTIFKHPNAQLYVGTYNPNITGSKPIIEVVNQWVTQTLIDSEDTVVAYVDMSEWGRGPINEIMQELEQLYKLVKEVIAIDTDIGVTEDNFYRYLSGAVDSAPYIITWNHAKIVAVNGRSLLTGGANYYDLYNSTGTLIDNDITILGDAARTGHSYADYLWKYLNSGRTVDTSSVVWYTKLAAPAPDTIPMATQPAPLFPTDIPQTLGDIRALSTTKEGNLAVTLKNGSLLDYPMQLTGAPRDLLMQMVWAYGDHANTNLSGIKTNTGALVMDFTNDTYQAGALKDINATPVSWASRSARNYAIANANHSVQMAEQMLVNWQQAYDGNTPNPAWGELVEGLNGFFGVKGTDSAWDGMMWPYDLMISFSKALSTIAYHHHSGQDPDAGIFIVLSEPESSPDADGYGDMTPLSVFEARLVEVMTSMAAMELLPYPVSDVAAVVKERFQMKRSVLQNADVGDYHKLHAKVVCVDGSLLYTGSDNAYLQYNEQFGIWIEEQENIAAWKKGFWDGLWMKAMRVD